jgi:hypothetical protein
MKMAEDEKTQEEKDAEAEAAKQPKAKPAAKAKTTPPAVDAKAGAGDSTKAKMLKAIGAKAEDVLAYNAEAKILVTKQGGKYQLTADGNKLKHLAGPAPTGGKKAAADEDDEE